MNGTPNIQVRSVQLAVMAAPSATLAEALAEARRRHDTPGAAGISMPVAQATFRAQAAAAG